MDNLFLPINFAIPFQISILFLLACVLERIIKIPPGFLLVIFSKISSDISAKCMTANFLAIFPIYDIKQNFLKNFLFL